MAKKSSTPRKPRAAAEKDERLDILWNRSERARLTAELSQAAEGSLEHQAIVDAIQALGEPR